MLLYHQSFKNQKVFHVKEFSNFKKADIVCLYTSRHSHFTAHVQPFVYTCIHMYFPCEDFIILFNPASNFQILMVLT